MPTQVGYRHAPVEDYIAMLDAQPPVLDENMLTPAEIRRKALEQAVNVAATCLVSGSEDYLRRTIINRIRALMIDDEPVPEQKILATEPTDEMVIAAMRAMEKCQPERLRYTERQKWHVNDMQGMRAALKAAFALMQPVPERLMPTPFTVEQVARLLCYERVAPACDCKQQGIPCKAPIENLLHESNPIRYQAEAVAKFIRPVPEQSIPASTATP